MHSIVLLTALTATSGLFGGHKGGGCGRSTRHHATYAAPVSTCSTGSCYSTPMTHYAAPAMSYPAPQAAPASQAMPVPPKAAASAPAAAPASYYVQSYYYAPTSPCANGQCYRR